MHRVETVVKKEECSDSVWIEVENAHDGLVIADKEYLSHKVKLKRKLLDDHCKAVKTEPVASISGENEQVYETQYSLKIENTSFGCTLCFEEFAHEHEYHEHMSLHLQAAASNGDCDTSQACENYAASSSRADSCDIIAHRHAAQMRDAVSFRCTDLAQTSVPSLTPRLSTKTVLPTDKDDKHKSRKHVLEIASTNDNLEAASEHKVPAGGNTRNTTLHVETNCLRNDIKAQFNHSLRTETVEKFICDFCQKEFKRKKNLVPHIKLHTIGKPYACELCKYKSTRNNELLKHMQTHTGEQPYPCKLCKYKFIRKNDLMRHMRGHTGEKPFSCELCYYKCALKHSLKLHMRTHTGEKPYSCTLCEYKCALKSSLEFHTRTHTGVKPYLCELCEYKSAYRHSLMLHMRTHTGEKPYSCKLCEYKGAHKCNWLNHMRNKHGLLW